MLDYEDYQEEENCDYYAYSHDRVQDMKKDANLSQIPYIETFLEGVAYLYMEEVKSGREFFKEQGWGMKEYHMICLTLGVNDLKYHEKELSKLVDIYDNDSRGEYAYENASSCERMALHDY